MPERLPTRDPNPPEPPGDCPECGAPLTVEDWPVPREECSAGCGYSAEEDYDQRYDDGGGL